MMQGLSQKLEEQRAELKVRDQKIAALEHSLAELQAQVNHLAPQATESAP